MDKKRKSNFIATLVLSNFMVGLKKSEEDFLSVYKKAKKNAVKITWPAGRRENGISAELL